MSLSDAWVEELGDVILTMMYRTYNRAIELDEIDAQAGTYVRETARLQDKGEQDVAWAVKTEYERRLEKQGGVLGSAPGAPGGVF